MTIAELFQWATIREWGDKRLEQLEQYLSNYIVIPVDQPLCREWAQIRANAQRTGKAISSQDAWIAATAIRHQIPLVTHNTKDFINVTRLQLLTPE
jgi:tRNA(fMet)-specific endonuclease VapC